MGTPFVAEQTYTSVEGVLRAFKFNDKFVHSLLVDEVHIVAGDHDPRHVLLLPFLVSLHRA